MNNEEQQSLFVAKLSLAIGFCLFFAKFYAFSLTGSQAILSDLLESVINISGSLVTLFIIKIAISPADKNHPYGHGKAEYFGAIFEGGAISLAGILIVLQSSYVLWRGIYEVKELTVGVSIIFLLGLINGGLGWYLQKKGKELNSVVLNASGKHLYSDFLTSVGIVVGLILVKMTDLVWLDPLLAIIIGFQLSYHGISILKSSVDGLMDAHDPKILNNLLDIFNQNKFQGIIRIHNVKIMRSGRFHHIDMHMVVPEYWSIEEGHRRSQKFSDKIFMDYKHEGEIHFHLDPCLRKYCHCCEYVDCPAREQEFKKIIPFDMHEILSLEENL